MPMSWSHDLDFAYELEIDKLREGKVRLIGKVQIIGKLRLIH